MILETEDWDDENMGSPVMGSSQLTATPATQNCLDTHNDCPHPAQSPPHGPAAVWSSAANRLIGEVVQSLLAY